MKLKKFESYRKTYVGSPYKEGDYVEVYYKYGTIYVVDHEAAKIFSVDYSYQHKKYFYTIVYLDKKEDTIDENSIVRKLTPEEVEEFKMKMNANIYNL